MMNSVDLHIGLNAKSIGKQSKPTSGQQLLNP